MQWMFTTKDESTTKVEWMHTVLSAMLMYLIAGNTHYFWWIYSNGFNHSEWRNFHENEDFAQAPRLLSLYTVVLPLMLTLLLKCHCCEIKPPRRQTQRDLRTHLLPQLFLLWDHLACPSNAHSATHKSPIFTECTSVENHPDKFELFWKQKLFFWLVRNFTHSNVTSRCCFVYILYFFYFSCYLELSIGGAFPFLMCTFAWTLVCEEVSWSQNARPATGCAYGQCGLI